MFDINGNETSNLYDINGEEITGSVYDINGNEVGGGQPIDPVKNYTDVIFTQGDIYARLDGTKLYRSMDNGVSFPVSIDVSQVGTIKNIHIFSDGTLNIFGHQSAFYSDDWQTLTACTVLDENGNAFVPTQYDNFSVMSHGGQRSVVNNVEMYVFGNYSITDESHQNKNVFYTIDKGHTYKVCKAFGLTAVRHIHDVVFNPSDSSFWLITGDSDGQSNVFKGTYNTANDTWTWTLIGNGYYFKWASVAFYDGYIYWTLDHTPGSVRRCVYNDASIADTENHEILLDNTPNDAINVIIDPTSGEMIVTLSIYGGQAATTRTVYYSQDRVNFDSTIFAAPSYYNFSDTMYYGTYGLNNRRKILSGLWSRAHEDLSAWDKIPSIWLDDLVRLKWPNAFKSNDSE